MARHSTGLTGNSQAKLLDVPDYRQLEVSAHSDAADTPPTLVLAGFDGLFRSDDSAASWTELQTQVATYLGAVALSPESRADSTLAVATYINGAFRSTDAGAEWTTIDKGLAHSVEWMRQPDYVARLTGVWFAPTYGDDHTMFVTSRGYVFRSTNRGRSWRRSTPPGMVVKGEFPPDYSLLVFSPEYTTDSTLFLGTDGGKVFRSSDGGDSYTKIAQLHVEISSLVVSNDFAHDATLVAGTPDGVYKSVDGGESWSPTAPLPNR